MWTPETLDELLCSFCHNYLSVPPIRSFPGGQNACGRCTINENFLPQHNTLYETVIKDLNFPCKYETRGCLKKTTPSYMREHEGKCSYRSFDCPSCCFIGTVKELCDHFEGEHPERIFKNVEFNIVGKNSYKKIFLHFSGNEMFTILVRHDEEDEGKLHLQVKYPMDEKAEERYVFTLRFSTKNHDAIYESRGNVGSNKTIHFRDYFDDPSLVLRNIETKRISDTAMNLLRAVECPVCFCHMSRPILQCIRGHSFCKTCHGKLKKCSICQRPMSAIRNVSLEKIVMKILGPCKYQRCPYYGSVRDVVDHEDNCTFKPVKN